MASTPSAPRPTGAAVAWFWCMYGVGQHVVQPHDGSTTSLSAVQVLVTVCCSKTPDLWAKDVCTWQLRAVCERLHMTAAPLSLSGD
jgi:hypothetical protein